MARPNRRRWAAPSRFPRTARVNELLREIIATELERVEDDDPRLDLVTVTGVQVETDLRHATVFFSALGTSATTDEVIAALDEQRIPLQAAIGSGARMKRTPLLRFLPDPGVVEGQKVETILRSLETNSSGEETRIGEDTDHR